TPPPQIPPATSTRWIQPPMPTLPASTGGTESSERKRPSAHLRSPARQAQHSDSTAEFPPPSAAPQHIRRPSATSSNVDRCQNKPFPAANPAASPQLQSQG